MNKVLACLAALLLASPVPARPTYIPTNNTVVQVVCPSGHGMAIFGSAVKIGEDKYITAAHVVKGGNQCYVQGKPITAVKLDDVHDFASFTGPSSTAVAVIDCSGFKAGKEYLAQGYANGWPEITYEPWLASEITLYGYNSFYGVSIPGMSGGAVVSKTGRVVGIVNMHSPARSQALKNTEVCK